MASFLPVQESLGEMLYMLTPPYWSSLQGGYCVTKWLLYCMLDVMPLLSPQEPLFC